MDIFNELTQDVKSLGEENWRFTAIAASKPDIVPLFWGNHKAYTGDTKWPQNSYPPVAIASEYQKGRFVALGHDGLLIDPSANNEFTVNILNWLGNNFKHKKVIIYTHITNWFSKNNLTLKAKDFFAARNIEIGELGSVVSEDVLKDCDIFIIVRPTRIIEPNEIQSIVSYVEHGGSLLMTGMGYFWEEGNNLYDIKAFPLNKLGEHLGFEYSKTSIDKTPLNNQDSPHRYSIIDFQPLSARMPIEVIKFCIVEHDNDSIMNSISLNKDMYHYVVEGEHVIISMPYRFFIKCNKPVDFIKQLDAVYERYANLTDGIKPFDGDKIVILNIDNMSYHMSSGNPILSRDDRIEYIIGELEKSNYKNPSWGLMHELGHGFIIGMKHYFVFGDGDNESWAEFFAFYACQELELQGKEPVWKENAKSYHESGERDFERIKNEKWLMIGFLNHVVDEYGWDTYKKMFAKYAERIRTNDCPEFHETRKKANLFVEELSLAAGANFYPYFARWGFPVNRPTYEKLKHLPRAKLFYPKSSPE